jgi:hypothetical protein
LRRNHRAVRARPDAVVTLVFPNHHNSDDPHP